MAIIVDKLDPKQFAAAITNGIRHDLSKEIEDISATIPQTQGATA